MKHNNTAFLSVIYPQMRPFIEDFFRSLQNQSDPSFDLIIVNDGFGSLKRLLQEFSQLNIIELTIQGTPAHIRNRAIEFIVLQKYKYLIWGDSDDYFEHNRVEVIKKLLVTHDIIVNDFDLVTANNKTIKQSYLSNRFDDKYAISITDIVDYNFLGLTNTGLRTELLQNFRASDRIIAYDWFLFSCVISKRNANTIFTNQTKSFYRQHHFNTIGLGEIEIKLEAFVTRAELKLIHYEEMATIDISYKPIYLRYKESYQEISKQKDKLYLEYTQRVENIPALLWWEGI
tara:strand:+ start:382 stop:1242 length:861 start_codon:yes stop_codon:yes gene_type:complete